MGGAGNLNQTPSTNSIIIMNPRTALLSHPFGEQYNHHYLFAHSLRACRVLKLCCLVHGQNPAPKPTKRKPTLKTSLYPRGVACLPVRPVVTFDGCALCFIDSGRKQQRHIDLVSREIRTMSLRDCATSLHGSERCKTVSSKKSENSS